MNSESKNKSACTPEVITHAKVVGLYGSKKNDPTKLRRMISQLKRSFFGLVMLGTFVSDCLNILICYRSVKTQTQKIAKNRQIRELRHILDTARISHFFQKTLDIYLRDFYISGEISHELPQVLRF